MKTTNKHVTEKELRVFGLLVGGVFAIIALWPIFWQLSPRTWAAGLAIALLFPAIFSPTVLRLPQRIWTIIGKALGWFNTRLILTLLYFVAILPIALLLRLAGRTPLKLNFDSAAETYREHPEDQSQSNISEQF